MGAIADPNPDLNTTQDDPGVSGLGTQIAAWYQKYLGRGPADGDIDKWTNGTYGATDAAGIEAQIAGSDEAKKRASGGGSQSGGGFGWVDDALKGAKSTDDPNYWYGKIKADPKAMSGDASAMDYWKGRIAQGDGAEGVRNGTIQKFNDSGAGGQGGGYNLASYLTNSPLLQPWTQPFNLTPFSSNAKFTPPADFKAPTDVTEQNDPGYQFRLKQGQQALERSASAKGTLLTGGTLKDLTDYEQGAASQEYGNVYSRSLQDWQNQYNSALTNFQTGYNTDLSNWTTNYNAANQQYQQAYNIFENNQAKQYNRIANMAGLGQTAAGQLGQSGLGYAGLNSGLITGGGNALAAGGVGSTNSWMNAFNNIGNIYGNSSNLGGLYGNNQTSRPDASSYV